jgi:hypothetical protein
MSKKLDLLTGVAVAALIASASSAFAQQVNLNGPLTQEAQNLGTVTNGGLMTSQGLIGIGASESINSSGASTIASVTTLNAKAPSVTISGQVQQTAGNSNTITNGGLILNVGYDLVGDGLSVSVGSSGAVNVLGYTSVRNTNTSSPVVTISGDTEQTATNTGLVGNLGLIVSGNIIGKGASVSVGASGATNLVGVSSIGDASAPSVQTEAIDQTATNSGIILNLGGTLAGNLIGDGSSTSVSASGATSAISVTNIANDNASTQSVGTGPITQSSDNNSPAIINLGAIGLLGNISGDGTSAGIGASGATSAIGVMSIGGTAPSVHVDGDISQNAQNTAIVANLGIIVVGGLGVGNVVGDGASLSISASGSTSAISYSSINSAADQNTKVQLGDVTQLAGNNNGPILNVGLIDFGGDLTGTGASVSVGASGATSAIGFSSLNSIGNTTGKAAAAITTGDINQGTVNNGRVFNLGAIDGGNVTGRGASLNVSASGATSAIAYTSINNNNSNSPAINTNNITQGALNFQRVTNLGVISAGSISGNGASASITAAGATSAIGVTSINDNNIASVKTGAIKQGSGNFAPISNIGVVSVAGVSGTGASLNIGASGATSAVSVSIMK